jgi:ATP-dependent RNA helicase DDX41
MVTATEIPRGFKRRRDSITEFERSLVTAPVASGSSSPPNASARASDSRTGLQSTGQTNGNDEEEDDYTPYVPVAKRRANLLSSLSQRQQPAKAVTKTPEDLAREQEALEREQEAAEEIRRERARKERTLLEEAQEVKKRQAELHSQETDLEREAKKEAEILAALERQQKKLASAAELAQGVTYTESVKTTYVSSKVQDKSQDNFR